MGQHRDFEFHPENRWYVIHDQSEVILSLLRNLLKEKGLEIQFEGQSFLNAEFEADLELDSLDLIAFFSLVESQAGVRYPEGMDFPATPLGYLTNLGFLQ